MDHHSVCKKPAINTSDIVSKHAVKNAVWTSPIHFLAFGFGSGLISHMPGTFGTLIAIPLYLMLAKLPWQLYLLMVVIAFLVGIWLCDKAEEMVGIPDYSGIVWDEIVGLWITLFLVPVTWFWIFFGFILFRILDIIKPWPISWLNRHVHKGFGIMVDDALAGFLAWVILRLVMKFMTIN